MVEDSPILRVEVLIIAMSKDYVGSELEIFEHALLWKKYWKSKICQYVKGHVLEVGAGIGGTTVGLVDGVDCQTWTCLEPDSSLLKQLSLKIEKGILPNNLNLVNGTIDNLSESAKYDLILYIDVLEHIKEDSLELVKVAKRLNKGAHLVVLVPAHNFLFSKFDEAIGHHRRYNKKMLKAFSIPSLKLSKVFYLDSVGLIASLVNKTFLKQSYPTLKQISFWDKVIVPASKLIDPISFNLIGKTVVGVWVKE